MPPEDFRCKNARWRKVIWSIDEQLTAIDGESDDIIATDPGLARQREFLTSIDGVGDRIAVNMLALAGGFTRFRNARQFCSFASLVPYKYESGTSVCSRARTSKQANQTMKALLHMAAVGAAPPHESGRIQGVLRAPIGGGETCHECAERHPCQACPQDGLRHQA